MTHRPKPIKDYYEDWLIDGAIFTDLATVTKPNIPFNYHACVVQLGETHAQVSPFDVILLNNTYYCVFDFHVPVNNKWWFYSRKITADDVGKRITGEFGKAIYLADKPQEIYIEGTVTGCDTVEYIGTATINNYIYISDYMVGKHLMVDYSNVVDNPNGGNVTCTYTLSFDDVFNFLPWFSKDDTNQSLYLDMQLYHLCADKSVNRFFTGMVENYETTYRTQIALYLWRKFREKWQREYVVLMCNTDKSNLQFSPLENYDRKEELYNKTTVTPSSDYKAINTDKRSAFNSGSVVTTNANESTMTGCITTEVTSKDNDGNYSHIHGNIGVTKTGEIVDDALTIYQKNYIDRVCHDIMGELCLKLY